MELREYYARTTGSVDQGVQLTLAHLQVNCLLVSMVLILDGNSKHGAQICIKHVFLKKKKWICT